MSSTPTLFAQVVKKPKGKRGDPEPAATMIRQVAMKHIVRIEKLDAKTLATIVRYSVGLLEHVSSELDGTVVGNVRVNECVDYLRGLADLIDDDASTDSE